MSPHWNTWVFPLFCSRIVLWLGIVLLSVFRVIAAEPLWPEAIPTGGFTVAPSLVQLRIHETGSPAPTNGTIRYTLNGDVPSENSLRYRSALQWGDPAVRSNLVSMIPGTATVNQHTDGWKPPRGLVGKANIIRAQVFTNNLPAGPWISHTYFSGKNPMATYGLPVVSITVATNELFNYTSGIYVLGRVFDDYVKLHPGEPLTGHTPANYTQRGDAWERPAYLEWFEPTGERSLAQAVFIDIQGQSSRSFRQKSLGLKSKADGLSPDDFKFVPFPGWTNRQGKVMARYDHLRLANSGNDWAYTLLRDALCHQLAGPTRLDTLAYRPVVVYLDGEFWGVHNLREQQDPDFISDHYDMLPSEVVICEGPGLLQEGEPGDQKHYEQLIQFVEKSDMAQATNYAVVKTLMDVENYAVYQASEIYFANADWPHNNIRFWRKRTASYDPAAAYGHDGRWRWLLFDVDLGYGHAWSGGVNENSLALAMASGGRIGTPNHWSTTLFRRLLLNPEFKNLFINTTADLLNTVYRDTRATNLVQSMQGAIAPAMNDHIARWRAAGDSTNGWRNEVTTLRLFAAQRPAQMRQNVISEFKLGGFAILTLDLEPRGAGEFRVHSIRVREGVEGSAPTNTFPWKGTYFRGVPFEVEAIARPGYRFVGWKNQPELGIEPLRKLQLNSATNLIAVFERTLTPHALGSGPYALESWSSLNPAGTYPASMLFEQSSMKDPELGTPMSAVWTLPYNLKSRSRIVGLETAGVGFINTSDPQASSGAGYVGSAVLAINSLGVTQVHVSWIGGTVTTNEQDCALRLQWALGDGPFQDVVDRAGNPVEYRRQPIAGDRTLIGPTLLPNAAANQPYLRLRWKYYLRKATSGPRALLQLDDIWVAGDSQDTVGRLEWKTPVPGNPWRLQLMGQPRVRWRLEVSTDLSHWSESADYVEAVTDLNGLANWVLSRDPLIKVLGYEEAVYFRARRSD